MDQKNERFIMMLDDDADAVGASGSRRDEIRFVVNWFEELRQLVPPLK